MMTSSAPLDTYRQKIEEIKLQLKSLKTKRSAIGWARFACILLAAGGFYFLFPYGFIAPVLIALAFIAIFLKLVLLASSNNEAIDNHQRLLLINEDEISIAEGVFHDRHDGTKLLPAVHDYAYDLDVFGPASLYQYINRTVSQQGNATLAQWLLKPVSPDTIPERQAAVRELAPQYEWRQQLQAYGMEQVVSFSAEKIVTDWLNEENKLNHKTGWKILRVVYPVITLTTIILYLTDVFSGRDFTLCYLVFLAVSGGIKKKITPYFGSLDKIVSEVTILGKSMTLIEGISFKSPWLQQVQDKLLINNMRASVSVKQLKSILDRLDDNLNLALVAILNPFLLWDVQQIFRLEKWRTNNKAKATQWFSSLGLMEAISTLANIHFNHPGWCFPVLNPNEGAFIAQDLGHPLIAESKRVTSSFSTSGKPQVALITGSNMAGKSTFLRSVGINIVLAMTGSPVCATNCSLSPMRVVSSMRIADNLAESTSTFYAELKKLKYIIEQVNNQEKVFLLLDEILRGTNSLDRHTGSHALVNQLIRRKAVGILATHDLELAKLSEEHPQHIHNYHFDVQVENDELYFDYKLKEGICKSLNASILMKKIGIEL